MTGRRAIFGLCMLCAMAFSAIAAQGASAGQTAFTCVSTATTKDFSSEHCVPGQTGTAFGHVAITEETHAKLSNEKTNATTTGPSNSILKEVIAATPLELESTGAIEGLGILKNEEVGGVMQAFAESDANGITYHGVVVNKPENKGCKVFEDKENKGTEHGAEGVVKTRPVKGHTTVVTEAGVEKHSVIIEPATAGSTLFATFFIECTKGLGVPEELEGLWKITGKITCPTNGATIVCEHETVTNLNTLKGKGAKAGLEGKATITAGKFPVTEPTHAVSVTTTTP